jgi:alkylation response protein AidB-like acyl-CoA dehydrogenase
VRFELNDDQALLRSSTRELLEKEAPLSETRAVMEEAAEGYSKAFYQQLGELGYPGLLLDPEAGGLGAVAYAVVLAEMGRVAFPGPFLDLALAVRTLAGCSDGAARGMGDRAAAGEALVVLARAEDTADVDPKPSTTRFRDGRVVGTKVFVPFGAHADALLVDTAEGLAVVERPGAGWNATALPTLDHAQRFATVVLDDPGTLVADPARSETLLADATRLGALGAAAQMFGAMERALEIAVAYTSERRAFGAPIGSFQALQHRCADMLLQTESTRSAAFRAAWAEESEPAEAPYLVSVAKAWAGPAGRFVCGQAIQLLGGVGFTWEYDPHIYLKRIKTLEAFHGTTRWHTENALRRSPTGQV